MLRKILSLVFLIVFLVWVIWFVRQNAQDFSAISTVRLSDVLALVGAFLIIMICNGAFIAIVTAAFRIRLQTAEWLSLSFFSSFANYFLPFRGGAGLRAIYLSRLHALPIAEFASTLSVMYLMHIIVNGLLAMAGMAVIAINGGAANITLLLFFLLASLAGIFAMTINIEITSEYRRFPMAQLSRLLTGVRTIRGNRALVNKLWSLMLILTIATVWQCAVAFKAVSVPISWSGILVYAASKNLGALIGLTPGSLGIVELISVYLGKVLDYSTSDALMVQGLIRSVAISVLLIFGPVALLFLQRKFGFGQQRHDQTSS